MPTNLSAAPSSQFALRATPSSTARVRWPRVVVSPMPWKPARALRSSIGDRSPVSHGVKTTPPAPGGVAAASASSAS